MRAAGQDAGIRKGVVPGREMQAVSGTGRDEVADRRPAFLLDPFHLGQRDLVGGIGDEQHRRATGARVLQAKDEAAVVDARIVFDPPG